jgi:outer membrane protein OmpA-like peptidoglycan-associated protein
VIHLKRKSDWKFNTSYGANYGVEMVVASTTDLILTSPQGVDFTCHLVSGGMGASLGNPFVFNLSTKQLYSKGLIWMLDTVPGHDLTIEDFEGYCIVTEGSAAAGGGGAVDLVLFGIRGIENIPAGLFDAGLGGPVTNALFEVPRSSYFGIGGASGATRPDDDKPLIQLDSGAKAVLASASVNVGFQLTVGLAGSIGWVWADRHISPPPPPLPKPVKVTPTKIYLSMGADALFDFNKDDLKRGADRYLKHFSDVIQGNRVVHVQVSAHTDSVGSGLYNLGLSYRRANSIVQWLIINRIVTAERITPVGYGAMNPKYPNNTSKNRAMNRRVDVEIQWAI